MILKKEIDTINRRLEQLQDVSGGHQISFREWLVSSDPKLRWDWPHMDYMINHLELLDQGQIKRLMVFLPPRHAKSTLVTVKYTAYKIATTPSTRVIVGTYAQDLAERFSRYIRRAVRPWVPLNVERTAVADWETVAGGGVRAAGVGSGVTGLGANLIIIDDPVKSREQANSATHREREWDWYTNDLYTRLEPDASIILIMTRWHNDDLAGRILNSADAGNWTVVSLPAEAEENDPLGRAPGEPLWAERYDLEALYERRAVLGNHYSALYQQRPLAREGDLFKRNWFDIIRSGAPQVARVRYWDKAGSAGTGAYTCGVLIAKGHDGQYFVEDVVRGQWSSGTREKIVKQTAELDRQRFGHVAIWVEQEPGSGGKESAEATIRNLAGFAVRADRVTGDKITRTEPFAAQCEAGNVKLIRCNWNEAYLDELTSFPFGKYSDQVDASAGAFNKLTSSSNFIPILQQRQARNKRHDHDVQELMRKIDLAHGQQLLDLLD